MLSASPSPSSSDSSIAGTSAASSFAAAVTTSHIATLRCELWSATQYLTTLYPTGGSVEVDARRRNRRSLSMTITDPDGSLLPTSETALLSPFTGNEVRLWRGVKFSDGSVAEVPLGVFPIVSVEVDTGTEGTVLTLSCEDRSYVIARRKFTSVFTIAAGTSIATAIANVLAAKASEYPASNIAATEYTTTALQPGITSDTFSNPWEFCSQLALVAGQELFVDAYGVITTQTITDLSNTQTVLDLTSGSSGVLLDLQRSFTIEGIQNTVTVSVEGSGTATPWSVQAQDDNPNSPTRVSLYGASIPYTLSTPFIPGSSSDTAQADFVAGKLLQTVIGQPFTMTMVPNAALDVRDVVRLQNTALGADVKAVVDVVSIPLTAGETMSVSARALTL